MTQADAPTSENAPAPPRRFRWRRLVQYRLRTLLVLMTLAAIWFAWWSYHARQQRNLVAVIKQAGGLVRYDFEMGVDEDGFGVEDLAPRFWPKWLVNTIGVDYFADVTEMKGPGVRPPHLADDANRIYITDKDMNGVTALHARTGKTLWHSPGPAERMLLSGELLLAAECGYSDTAHGRWLVARETATGSEKFRVQLPLDFDPLPIVEAAGLFLVQDHESPGGKGNALVFDRTGRVRQRFDRQVVDITAWKDQRFFLTSRDIVGISPEDKTIWTIAFQNREWLAGGKLLDLPDGGLAAYLFGHISDSGVRVLRLDPQRGVKVWEVYCKPLGVSHSAYDHLAAVELQEGLLKVTSVGSYGSFIEWLDPLTGKTARPREVK